MSRLHGAAARPTPVARELHALLATIGDRSPRRRDRRPAPLPAVSLVERLNLAALGAVAVLDLVAHRNLGGAHATTLLCALLAVATVIVARLPWTSRRAAAIHFVAATAVLVFVYESLGPIIAAVGPPPRDSWMIGAERALSGGMLPLPAPPRLPTAVVDAFTVAYAVYFALPLVVAATALRRSICGAEAMARTLLLAFYTHYALFIVVPAVGPVRAAAVPAEARAGFAAAGSTVSHLIRGAISRLEHTPQDAFPSAHTSITLLVAAFARRQRLRWRSGVYALAAAIICSTVVLGYHYVIDVAAALPLAWAAWRIGLSPRLPQPAPLRLTAGSPRI